MQLGTTTADANGNISADVTLPDDVTPGYEVIASGVGPDGQPRSVICDVTEPGSASGRGRLLTPDGSAAIVLAAYAIETQVHVTASGFRPLSTVRLSVRYTPARAALTRTGADIGSEVAIGASLLLIGLAAIAKARARHRSVA